MERWIPADGPGRMARGPLHLAAMLVDSCVEGARVFWSFWGPFGEPAIALAESVAGMQRTYLSWLGELSGARE